ncbi:homeobox domain-containing protein [Kistimonas scapharcae]|uniref:homeobox domain-containing protein n=1 Tax=Kistimonas scapharcae TaxID=1036133 RepID=UPI003CD0AFFB
MSGLLQGGRSSSEQSPLHNPSCGHIPDSGRHYRRTRVSDGDRKILDEQFKENPYPDAQRKEELAQCTCLNLKQLTTWFANRRAKAKKECNKKRAEAAPLSYVQHPPVPA